MSHYIKHQLYNFNILAFFLICGFVIVFGQITTRKELKKHHQNIVLELMKLRVFMQQLYRVDSGGSKNDD